MAYSFRGCSLWSVSPIAFASDGGWEAAHVAGIAKPFTSRRTGAGVLLSLSKAHYKPPLKGAAAS